MGQGIRCSIRSVNLWLGKTCSAYLRICSGVNIGVIPSVLPALLHGLDVFHDVLLPLGVELPTRVSSHMPFAGQQTVYSGSKSLFCARTITYTPSTSPKRS